MTTVTENFDLPAGVDPSRAVVDVQLFSAAGVPLREAFDTAAQKTIVGRRTVVLDGASSGSSAVGSWSLDLAANSTLTPTGTVWGRTVHGPQLDTITSYATVPSTGGPYRWDQILDDPPAALESSALTTHKAAQSTHGWTVSGSTNQWTGNLKATGDLTVSGRLLTGRPVIFGGSGIVFGGIEGEGRVIGAGALMSPTATMTFADGVPRLVLPNGVRTDVYAVFALEEWWLASTIGLFIEWVAESDAGSNGNVKWQFALKEVDIGTEGPATAGTPVNVPSKVEGAPALGRATTTQIASIVNGNPWTPVPGPFASFYCVRMTRLATAADTEDTLEGPVGLVELSYVRGF